MYNWMDNIESSRLKELILSSNEVLYQYFDNIDTIIENNQYKVLKAFKENNITEGHLWGSTGYGYGDLGRDGLDRLYASIFNTEAGLVRQQFVSGTHCLSSCLFGILNPKDHFMYITGKPYDTLEKTIGIVEHPKSLISQGIEYNHVDLLPDGNFDIESIKNSIKPSTKMIAIQRSKGYSLNRSIDIAKMKSIVDFIKNTKKDIVIFVDNCYGEFTECLEPTDVGVDIMAGSLIKNPGGGLALTGGYVVGRKDLVKKVAEQLTAPGLGNEVGASLNNNLPFYQGIFLAPKVVGDSLKSSIYAAFIAKELGFDTHPKHEDLRTDIVQGIIFNNEKSLIKFCQGIQHNSPIDSFATPVPDQLPGYQVPVIMAAGTFIQGASIELSADAPIKTPYIGYLQGSLTFQHGKIAISMAFDKMLKDS